MGFIITSDGDVEALFSNRKAKRKGALNLLIPTAVALGGRKLDCYGGGLENMYARYGAEAHGKLKFDEAYAPKGWDGSKYDIVAMSLPRSLDEVIKAYNPNRTINLKDVDEASDYDSLKAMRDKAMKSTSMRRSTQKSAANGLIVK